MEAHAKLSASGASRWMACPGSVQLSVGMPNSSSSYAKEGTAAHAFAEFCLKKVLNNYVDFEVAKIRHETVDVAKLAGEISFFEGESFTVTEDMAEAVQLYVDTVQGDLKDGMSLAIEKKFCLDWIDKEMFGTNDASIGDPFQTLRVYDYKHGAGIPVEVKGNVQMLYYALGAAKNGTYTDIELVIVQPRCHHDDGPVRRWSLTMEELLTWEKDVFIPAINKAKSGTGELSSGSHCKFCPAAAKCPKLKEKALVALEEEFSKSIELMEPSLLSDEQLSKIYESKKILTDYLKAVEEYIKAKLQKGEGVEGWKLVKGVCKRSYIDEEKALKVLTNKFGKRKIMKVELMSPTQMEKKFGAEAKALFGKLVHAPEGAPRLVPETHKSPALTFRTVEQDFE